MLTRVCVCVCERGINPQQQRFRFFFLMSQIMKVIEKGNIAHDRRTEIEFKRSVKAVAKKKESCTLEERRACQVTRTCFSTGKKENLFHREAPTTALWRGRAPRRLNRGFSIFK